MYNNTQDQYKEAVKNEYEKVKNGQYSIYLSAPTRSKLTKLCWEIYEGKKMSQNDLNIFNALLGLPFDINNKRGFRDQKNKFRPIETFFKGETNPLEMDKVDLAAVLVDYQPRPFSKFRTSDLSLDYKKNDSSRSGSEIEIITETKKPTPTQEKLPSIYKFIDKLLKARKKETVVVVGVIISVLFMSIWLKFFKKGCMQWSDNHYELVYCDKPIEGNLNDVIKIDDNLLNFRKLQVCDTTTCFKPDGEAIVWYAKRGERAEFFSSNGNGRHPETKKPLRPVTEYIKGKYKGDCISK